MVWTLGVRELPPTFATAMRLHVLAKATDFVGFRRLPLLPTSLSRLPALAAVFGLQKFETVASVFGFGSGSLLPQARSSDLSIGGTETDLPVVRP